MMMDEGNTRYSRLSMLFLTTIRAITTATALVSVWCVLDILLQTLLTTHPHTNINTPTETSSALFNIFLGKFEEFVQTPRNFCATTEGSAVTLLIVHSAVGNTEKRQFVRDNYAIFAPSNTRLIFALGLSANDTVNRVLREEGEIHRDLLQGTFLDSYRNLSRKALSWLRYADMYCSRANISFIVKFDDDAAINYQVLQTVLQRRSEDSATRSIVCAVRRNHTVLRNKNKWKVTKEEYSPDVYPPHCPGLIYMITYDMIGGLCQASKAERPFWIDDVYITGILPSALPYAVSHHSISGQTPHSCSVFQTQTFNKHRREDARPVVCLTKSAAERTTILDFFRNQTATNDSKRTE